MSTYLTLRNWVDRRWKSYWSVAEATILPVVPLALMSLWADSDFATAAAIILGAAWISFVAWRGLLWFKLESAAADRHFDAVGKYKLSKDYHDTESATAAAKRKSAAKGNANG